MSEPQLEAKRPSTVVKCEKHGLHYDSSKTTGCVICRREAGGGTATMAARGAASAPRGSLGQALAVTAILLVLATACLYFVHGMAIEAFQAWTNGSGDANALDQGFEQPMEDMSLPTEDTGGETYSGSEGDGD